MTTPRFVTKKNMQKQLRAMNEKREMKMLERKERGEKRLRELNEKRDAKRAKDNARLDRHRKNQLGRDDMLAGEDWQQQQQLDRHELEIMKHDKEIGHLIGDMKEAKRVANNHEGRITALENAEHAEIPIWGGENPPNKSQSTTSTEELSSSSLAEQYRDEDLRTQLKEDRERRQKVADAKAEEEIKRNKKPPMKMPLVPLGICAIILLLVFASWGGIIFLKREADMPGQASAATQQPATVTQTSQQPGIPDGGAIKCDVASRKCDVTLGKGIGDQKLSDPVYTEQTTAVVYSLTGPGAARLGDDVKVMFPNGVRGKANASDNYNGQWNPQESPLRFQGPQGTKIVVSW